MNGPLIHHDLTWRAGNLWALLALTAVAGVGLLTRLAGGPVEMGSSPPHAPQQVQAARERINPNTAEGYSLQRLPHIGPARAQAIIDYRQDPNHGNPPFIYAEDVTKVRGIGPATLEDLREHLSLPSRTPLQVEPAPR